MSDDRYLLKARLRTVAGEVPSEPLACLLREAADALEGVLRLDNELQTLKLTLAEERERSSKLAELVRVIAEDDESPWQRVAQKDLAEYEKGLFWREKKPSIANEKKCL